MAFATKCERSKRRSVSKKYGNDVARWLRIEWINELLAPAPSSTSRNTRFESFTGRFLRVIYSAAVDAPLLINSESAWSFRLTFWLTNRWRFRYRAYYVPRPYFVDYLKTLVFVFFFFFSVRLVIFSHFVLRLGFVTTSDVVYLWRA